MLAFPFFEISVLGGSDLDMAVSEGVEASPHWAGGGGILPGLFFSKHDGLSDLGGVGQRGHGSLEDDLEIVGHFAGQIGGRTAKKRGGLGEIGRKAFSVFVSVEQKGEHHLPGVVHFGGSFGLLS